ncbi:MAG: metal-dependent hydrolase [Cytophagaceae bacterium]
MASIFGHALAGIGIARSLIKKPGFKIFAIAVLCTIIPDADVLGHFMGIPYHHPFGHRGFTHSVFFAVVLSAGICFFGFKEYKFFSGKKLCLFSLFLFATMSHGLLDSLTNGGLGVAYFFPFDNTRYFFPYRPIQVSPIGVKNFFSEWGIRVIKSELIWIGIPSFILYLTGIIYHKIYNR